MAKRRCFIWFLLLCQLIQGQIHIQESNYANSELYKLKAKLQTAEASADSTQIAIAHILLGDYFYNSKFYTEAAKHYQDFLVFHKIEDSVFVDVQNSLAMINLELNQYSEAKDHAKIGRSVSIKVDYPKGEAISSSIIGAVEEKAGNYNSALKYQQKSLEIFVSLNDSTGLARTNENIGSIYEDLEQFQLACDYFLQALNIADESKDSDLRINIINNLGDIHRKTKNYNAAIRETQKALELAKTSNNQKQQVSALKDLSKTYAEIGDFKRAYNYLNNQRIISEEQLIRNNTKMISTMEVLYGLREKEAELTLLNEQNKISKARNYVVLVIVLMVLLALVLGLLYWKKRRDHDKRIFNYKQKLLQADLDRKTVEEAALNREIEIKTSSLANYSLNLVHKNKMLSDVSKTLTKLNGRNSVLINKKLKELTAEIDFDIRQNNEWSELTRYFSQIHPSFFETLKKAANQKTSASEMRLCMLMRLNLSSKEIAGILHITSDSVRIARYRLRKKLPIDSTQDLQEFLSNL